MPLTGAEPATPSPPCAGRRGRRGGVGPGWRAARWALALLVAGALAACASLPDVAQRAPVLSLPVVADAPLARLARASVPPAFPDGMRLLAASTHSLQARLALIERAQVSLDLQYYVFKGDETGRVVMRALRDAAARGVRVRLLIDDLYAAGDQAVLLGLAAHERIEVRLFNPLLFGRNSMAVRLAAALLGPDHLHRRMHNKLFIADGVFAIAGGRNIADEYFLRGQAGGFIDFDVLVAGAVVAELARAFDPYWNSESSHDLRDVLRGATPAPQLRASFDAQVAGLCSAAACVGQADEAAVPPVPHAPIRWDVNGHAIQMHGGQALAAADEPGKIHQAAGASEAASILPSARVLAAVAAAIVDAKRELVVVSPYLIPGANGVEAIRRFRQRGVSVTLMTNSLAATDERLVHLGYRRYRAAVLGAGAELYEWSPLRSGRVFRQLLRGEPVLRLHAKCALIDGEQVYLGSMNFDPRSRDLNTESGLLIRSPALAAEMHELVERFKRDASWRVVLAEDGTSLRWLTADGSVAADGSEPDTDFWSRLLLDLLAPFVPDEML